MENQILTIRGTKVADFVCEGMGKLKRPFNDIDAFYIPSFNLDLISEFHLRQFFNLELINASNPENDTIIGTHIKSGTVVTFRRNENNLYRLENSSLRIHMTITEVKAKYNKEQITFMLRVHELHRRTGYCGLDKLTLMVRHNVIHGVFDKGTITPQDVKNYADSLHKLMCKGCPIGKFQNENASSLDNIETAHTCDTAHLDVMHVIYDKDKRLNYIICKDRFSGVIMLELIQSLDKEDIHNGLLQIKSKYSKYGNSLKDAHLDSATSFRALKDNLAEIGIHASFHTPHRHVRRAEASIKTIKRFFRAVLADLKYKCPYVLYTWIIQWVVENYNMTLNAQNDYTTPWTKFTGKPVSFHNNFRVAFGDIVTFPTHANNSNTDESRASIGIVIGRETSYRGGIVVKDLSTYNNKVRHQVRTIEANSLIMKNIANIGKSNNSFIFHDTQQDIDNIEFELLQDDDQDASIANDQYDIMEVEQDDASVASNPSTASEATRQHDQSETVEDNDSYSVISEELDNLANSENTNLLAEENNSIDHEKDNSDSDNDDNNNNIMNLDNDESQEFQSLRRSSRSWKPNRKYYDFHPDLNIATEVDLKIKSSIVKHGLDLTKRSINDEINQLISKNVWEAIPKNIRVSNIIPSKMIIKEKYDSLNNFEKLKSRLVACGNFQSNQNDEIVAAPTVSINTVYLYLAIAAKRDMQINVFDIGGAYLNATLDDEEKIFIRINSDVANLIENNNLKSFIRRDGDIIVRLKKCLYGLRISGRKWYELISSFLITDCNYVRSRYDPCSFYKLNGKLSLLILYVDDLMVASQDVNDSENLYQKLLQRFEVVTRKDGNVLSFLRMTLKISTDEISIDQEGYITANFKGNAQYPHDTSFDIRKYTDCISNQEVEKIFNSKLMQMMYVGIKTRPDILYNLSALSTLTKCDESILKVLEKLEGYINATKNYKLSFKRTPNFHIRVYADASFRCHADLKSHMGYCIFIDDYSSPIIFKSNKLKHSATSTTDAELIALSEAVKYGKVIKNQMKELGIDASMTAYEDNMAGVSIARNRNISFSNKTRTMDRAFLDITEMIENKELTLLYVPSEDQIADILTKATDYSTFRHLRDALFKNDTHI